MIEYAKIVLWGVSFERELFRKELNKIAEWCSSAEVIRLKDYCYEKYYDMFPEILDEVFLSHTSALSLIETQNRHPFKAN